MAREKQVAVLYAGLKVRDTGFAAGLRKAKNDAMRELRAITGVLGGPMGLLGLGGGVAGFAALGVQAGQAFAAGLERADQTGKQANRLGLLTREYSGFSYAARQADVDQEQFADGMSRMLLNMREAQQGSKALREQFQGLGLDVDQLTSMDGINRLLTIADAYNRIGSVDAKLDFARTIFGRGNAASFMSFLGEGRASIVAMLQDAQSLGLVIDGIDASKADAANDAMLRTRDILEGFWNQLSVKAAPALTQVNDLLADLVKTMGGVETMADKVIEKVAMGNVVLSSAAGWIKGQAGATARTANVMVGPDPRDTYNGKNYISSVVNGFGLRALVDSGYRDRLSKAFFSAQSFSGAVGMAAGEAGLRFFGGSDGGEAAKLKQAQALAAQEDAAARRMDRQEKENKFWKDYWEWNLDQYQKQLELERKLTQERQKRSAMLALEHMNVMQERERLQQESLITTPVSSLSPFVSGRAMMARFAQFAAADAATIGSGPPPQVRELKEIKSTLERIREEVIKLVGLPNPANGVQIALPVGG